MKVLIVNELFTYGGAEEQSKFEKLILEKENHQVCLLTFDPSFSEYEQEHKNDPSFYNIYLGKNRFVNLARKLLIDRKLEKAVKDLVDKMQPDVIHINNIFSGRTVYRVLSKYPCVQTLRDYGVVCPKQTCIDKKGKECKGFKGSNCVKKCYAKNPVTMLEGFLKTFYLRMVYRTRRRAVKRFASPSKALALKATKNGLTTACINNPLLNKDFPVSQTAEKEKGSFLYYGAISSIKGISEMLDVFDEFSEGKDVKLSLAGRVDEKIRPELEQYMKKNKKIHYLGLKPHSEIFKLVASAYAVIVPSLWIENYPNTVLEPMAMGRLVIGANRGGIAEQLGEGRGILFNILKWEDFLHALEKAYNMPEEEYRFITGQVLRYIEENNTEKAYYQNIMSVFRKICRREKE